ncbi:MAG: MATE family efflux transporter [Oscillospiraceae bacterium]|nr:MATE family efflux transporter [Oscillospiraceae bacterium]
MSTKTLHITDESQSVTKTIVLLAWPVFLEQIFTTLVSYADTAMVGSLGAWATASVTISNPPIMLLNGIVMALGVGITSLVARGVGAKDPQTVKKLMHHAIWAIIVIGIPICLITTALHRMIPLWMGAGPDILDAAAQYNLIISFGRFFMVVSMMLNSAFRGYGDTKTPLLVNTVMNIVNVIFNFLLIYPTREISLFGYSFTVYGAGLEVNGAAIASSLGMAVAGLMTLWVAFFRKNEYQIHMKNGWKIDKALTKQIFGISFPSMLERIFMSSSGVFVTSSIAALGTANVAANSLCLTAESLSYMPAFAFQTAVTTLVGQSLGAKKPTLAEKFVRQTLFMGVVAMAFTGAGLFVFSNQLIGVFTPDADVIALAAHCLRLVAFMQIPQVAAWIFSGVLRGAGDTKFNFYITAATNWGIRTLWSVLAIRVFHFGLFSTQVVMLVEIIVRLFLLYLRYRTGKWKYVLDR